MKQITKSKLKFKRGISEEWNDLLTLISIVFLSPFLVVFTYNYYKPLVQIGIIDNWNSWKTLLILIGITIYFFWFINSFDNKKDNR